MLSKQPKIWWLIAASLLVMIFEFFSLAGATLPKREAIPIFIFLILAIGYQTIYEGFKALFKLNFKSINLLMVIAVSGAFYLGEYPEGAIVIVLFTLAEHLESASLAKSKSSLDRLLESIPKQVYRKGQDTPVDVSTVLPGDLVIIKPFQVIPLDGVVSAGTSFVDESTITGEPLCKDKGPGDLLFGGSFNQQGALEMKVTSSAAHSAIAKIREMTFQGMKQKAQTQKFIEQFSRYYTPSIMLLAAFWIIVPWLFWQKPFVIGFKEALSLLVIACPCALVISTPISIFSAIGNASASGILIKGGKYLEAIGNIKAMALDKTRTLTYGHPVICEIIPFGNYDRQTLLSCAAGIESLSEHPFAQSVVGAARKENLEFHSIENFESILGKGSKADCLVCSDRHHCLGKLEFILEEHKVPDDILAMIENLHSQGKIVIVISTHREVKGLIVLKDEIRPESAAFIQELKKLNIEAIMLTGDHQESAQAVARKIGITEVHANLLPEAKGLILKKLISKFGAVGMVGDGINDAPALAISNVGISMTSLGSDMALEAASIVILNNHLDLIPNLIRLGRKTLKTIKINTAFAILIKLIVIALALLGLTQLALAIFADVGVTILVILNSLRLMNWKGEQTLGSLA